VNTTNRTVVVTGIGATTPLGGDSATTWEGLVAGRSGVAPLQHEWAADLPVRIAAEAAVDPSEVIPRPQLRKLDRSAALALIATREAWANAGFTARAGDDPAADPTRVGAVIASGIGGVMTLMTQYDVLKEKGARKVSPHTVPMLMPNSPSANVSLEVGAQAGVHTPVSACASGAEAVGYAGEMIRSGRADVVVAGGTEACVHPLPIAAFANMMALSKNDGDPTTVSRPWDVARDGFVLGEGGSVLVLESEEHARARGAKVYAYALGAGISNDAHDIAQPDPEGRGGTRAIQRALEDGGISPADVAHINAHATSTPQGDIAEGLMIHATLGKYADEVAVTSTKSMTGHLLGGAGALESIATVLAIHHRLAPPTINLDNLDPAVELDIPTTARELADGDIAALNNSFGFGGANVAVAFGSI
jgi:3-oxoacyl-[acyl-carrier-protein] synthase II